MVMGCSSLVEHESDSTQTRPWGSANFPQTPEKFSGMEIGRKGEDTGKESKNNSAPPPQQRKQATSKQKQERKAKQRRRAYSILQTEAFHYYSTKAFIHSGFVARLPKPSYLET